MSTKSTPVSTTDVEIPPVLETSETTQRSTWTQSCCRKLGGAFDWYKHLRKALERSTKYELLNAVLSSSDFIFDVLAAYAMRNGVPKTCTTPNNTTAIPCGAPDKTLFYLCCGFILLHYFVMTIGFGVGRTFASKWFYFNPVCTPFTVFYMNWLSVYQFVAPSLGAWNTRILATHALPNQTLVEKCYTVVQLFCHVAVDLLRATGIPFLFFRCRKACNKEYPWLAEDNIMLTKHVETRALWFTGAISRRSWSDEIKSSLILCDIALTCAATLCAIFLSAIPLCYHVLMILHTIITIGATLSITAPLTLAVTLDMLTNFNSQICYERNNLFCFEFMHSRSRGMQYRVGMAANSIEDVPQLVIQSTYVYLTGGSTIVSLSIAFAAYRFLVDLSYKFRQVVKDNITPPTYIQKVLEGHTKWVMSVAMSGDTIVSASKDKTVRVWRDGSCVQVLEGHTKDVNSVAMSGDTIVSGSSDNTVRVWRDGSCVQVLEGHLVSVSSVAMSGDTIVSGSDDRTVRVWRDGSCVQVLEGHTSVVRSVAMSGDTIVSGSWDHTVRVWRDGSCVQVLEGHTSFVISVAMSGDTIVSGSWDCTVRVWRNGSCVQVLGHTNVVQSVAMSGDTIVSGSRDGTVRVWRDGSCVQVLEGHLVSVDSVAMSGDTIVSGSWDKTVRVWHI